MAARSNQAATKQNPVIVKPTEEDIKKKEEIKLAILNDLPLMKKYPKENPDALSMLIDYTIWTDLHLYSVSHTHFYQPIDGNLPKQHFKPSEISNTKLNTKLNLALEAERALKNVYVPV